MMILLTMVILLTATHADDGDIIIIIW